MTKPINPKCNKPYWRKKHYHIMSCVGAIKWISHRFVKIPSQSKINRNESVFEQTRKDRVRTIEDS